MGDGILGHGGGEVGHGRVLQFILTLR
jgi:hypothetical protein